jgi:hypothetical protein
VENTHTEQNKRGLPSPTIVPWFRKITNVFKPTNVKIAYVTNTTFNILRIENQQNEHDNNGIYELRCNTCKLWYIGQTRRDLKVRHKEHVRYNIYIRPQSAYAVHIVDNTHEYGTLHETIKLLKTCNKGTKLNCWETIYMQVYQQQGLLIQEQQTLEQNPLFNLVTNTRGNEATEQT